MKCIYYWIIPLLSVTAFADIDQAWQKPASPETRTFQRDPYSCRDGRQEALVDPARGKLGIVSYGMPVHWSSTYREILRRDHGVEHRTIAGCVVSEGILSYAAAYNDVMTPRILARHGPKVFEEAAAQAQRLHHARHLPLAEHK